MFLNPLGALLREWGFVMSAALLRAPAPFCHVIASSCGDHDVRAIGERGIGLHAAHWQDEQMRAVVKKRARPGAKARARPRAPGSEKKKEEGKGSSRARRLGDDLTGAARGDYIYSGIAYVCKYDIAHFDGGDHVSPADGIHCLRLQR